MPEDYNTLLAKYNRLVSRFNDLQTQVDEKQHKWDETESDYRKNDAAARLLCEQILAKDPDEMVLGTEYSWNKLNTQTLLEKAQRSFVAYNDGRTKLMKQIQAASEERRMKIDSLMLQLSHTMQNRKKIDASAPFAYDEGTGEVFSDEPESTAPSPSPFIPPETEKAINKLPFKVQEAAKSGAVSVVVVEDDGDVSFTDIQQQAEMARMGEVISLEKTGVKISPSAKKQSAMEKERKRQAEVMALDIEPIRERMNDRNWLLIEVIGKFGLCERSDIEVMFEKLFRERKMSDKPLSSGVVGYILKTLTDCGIVFMDNSVQHPIKSKFGVYFLSDIGRRFYEQQFGVPPVVSERDILIAQHDNLEHGFGIKVLKETLESSKEYTEVSMDRAKNTIKMTDGTQYIPDIMAVGKMKGKDHGFTAYMEYERDTHHQADFNTKMNKMSKNTRWLNIVGPNANAIKGLMEKVEKWIESRGVSSIRSLKIRVTSIKRLMDAVSAGTSVNDDKAWYATYILSNGPNPVIREK